MTIKQFAILDKKFTAFEKRMGAFEKRMEIVEKQLIETNRVLMSITKQLFENKDAIADNKKEIEGVLAVCHAIMQQSHDRIGPIEKSIVGIGRACVNADSEFFKVLD